MEEWQKQTIIQNLPKVVQFTIFNGRVKAELIANNILTQTDVENLVINQK